DTVYPGGTTVAAYSASLDHYPLFIRAGAIIPLDVKTSITGHGDATSAGKTTLAIYPRGRSRFTFHRPLGEGGPYADAQIDADATAGTVTITGSTSTSYRMRIKSLAAPTSVTGADTWTYDAIHKVVVADKQGASFTVVVNGLQGYP